MMLSIFFDLRTLRILSIEIYPIIIVTFSALNVMFKGITINICVNI